VSRRRNFSNWAYWRVQLDEVVASDPCPTEATATEFHTWRVRTRARLVDALGPAPADRVPLDMEVTESVDCGDYQRDRIVFDTETTMSVPAFLLVPHTRRDNAPGPAVLAIHGHGSGKALVCGIDDGGPGDDYAHQLASLGYVVLAPDLRGFGERHDWMPEDKYECDWNLVCATMAGVVPLQRNLWDMQCALDVLVAHELVDTDRIAVAGLSYGATTTLFLAALDERVRVAIVSGYLSSWAAAHQMPWNMCGSQVIPAQLGPEHRQRVEGTPPCRLGAFVDVDVVAEDAGVHELAFEVARQLAAGAGTTAVDDDRVEGVVRRVRAGKLEIQFFEPGLEIGHRYCSRNSGTSAPCHWWSPSKTSCCSASPRPRVS
jgi:dienelactone hydrolase